MSPDLVARVRPALEAQCYRVFEADVAGRPAVVGQRRLFRWRWMATQLKVTVVVAAAEVLSAEEWKSAVTSGFDLAKKAPGLPNGLQSGSALVCVLVVDRPEPAAVALAEQMPLRQWFKGITCSAILHAGTGTVHTFDGRQLVGRVYTGFLRSQRDLVLNALASGRRLP